MDPRLMERLAAELGESPSGIRRLSGGASYDSFQVETATGGRWLVRAVSTSPASIGLSGVGLDTEAELLRRVAESGVPVPGIRAFLGDPPALVLEWLDGESLGGRIARREEFAPARNQFAAQCGAALAGIHRTDPAGLGLPERTATDHVVETHCRYRDLGTIRPLLDAVARHLIDTAPPGLDTTLVHGDFRNGNLMVDPVAGIVGVLDWELAHVSDPLSDLGYLMVNSWRYGVPDQPVGGCGTAEDLYAAYEAGSGRSVDRARVRWWQVAGSFWWAVTCLVQARRFDPTSPSTVTLAAVGSRVSEAEVDCADLLIGAVEATPLTPGPDDRSGEAGLLESAVRVYRNGPPGSDYEERVVVNMEATLERERLFGATARWRERARLQRLLGRNSEDLRSLRGELADRLWHGHAGLFDAGVDEHLAATALDRLQIDQPAYRRAVGGRSGPARDQVS